MRGERFDDLVKTLATVGTRRRLLAKVGGLFAVSAVAGNTAVETTAACLPGDAPCDDDRACCSGVCTMHGRCGCFDAGHLCPDDGYCCSGVCRNHRCQ